MAGPATTGSTAGPGRTSWSAVAARTPSSSPASATPIPGSSTGSTTFRLPDGDKIDVSGITSGEGTFIGAEAFSHTAGEVRFVADAAGTNVYIDANGDGLADAGVRLLGVASLTSTDFVL